MQAAKVHTSTGRYSCRLVSSRLSSNQGSVLVYGHVSASGDAAGAACCGTACHSQGSHIHAMILSVSDYHRQPAAVAAGVADSDVQSALLADSNSPKHTPADQHIKYVAVRWKVIYTTPSKALVSKFCPNTMLECYHILSYINYAVSTCSRLPEIDQVSSEITNRNYI